MLNFYGKHACFFFFTCVTFIYAYVHLILIVAGQFVKHKLPDLLRSYIDAGKSSAFKVPGFSYKIESNELLWLRKIWDNILKQQCMRLNVLNKFEVIY